MWKIFAQVAIEATILAWVIIIIGILVIKTLPQAV